ncbi:MAG: YbaK/EbsC family protein [Clostridiales bacterium]|nr:YbaK/EbsC family protein [Clostridiales bacterium]
MSAEAVRAYLKQWERDSDIREFTVSSATVELAAQALGVAPERIAKTLSFLTPEGCLLVVAAGDARIDNSRFKAAFGCKAKMPAPEEVASLTGHEVGGVCPFAVPDGVRVYLDRSLRRFDTVFPAAGSAHSAIPLTCTELEQYSRAVDWVDVCRGWQPSPDLAES